MGARSELVEPECRVSRAHGRVEIRFYSADGQVVIVELVTRKAQNVAGAIIEQARCAEAEGW